MEITVLSPIYQVGVRFEYTSISKIALNFMFQCYFPLLLLEVSNKRVELICANQNEKILLILKVPKRISNKIDTK